MRWASICTGTFAYNGFRVRNLDGSFRIKYGDEDHEMKSGRGCWYERPYGKAIVVMVNHHCTTRWALKVSHAWGKKDNNNVTISDMTLDSKIGTVRTGWAWDWTLTPCTARTACFSFDFSSTHHRDGLDKHFWPGRSRRETGDSYVLAYLVNQKRHVSL